ncbi:phosphatase PAP2 family protein [Flavobacteriales bacterium]|nr:phosphatase PAP2 family protein [Flavobacteriales bacterium]
MLETLEHIDRDLFLTLNGLHSGIFDLLMPFISGNVIWIPLYIWLIYRLYKAYPPKKFYWILPILAVCILLTDQISVQLFKNIFLRYRPCHNEEIKSLIHLVDGCGGKYGFVSSHAANVFGIAALVSLLLKDRKITICLIFWAALVAYSRIYLGVHYPADILVGSVLGVLVGVSTYKAFYKFATHD